MINIVFCHAVRLPKPNAIDFRERLWYNADMVGSGVNNTAAGDRLKSVPQRAISVYELLLYAVLPFLLIMCGAMPTTAPLILPFVLPLLYLLYRRFGPYLSGMCIAVYGALSLLLNYDILSAVFFVGLFFAFIGLITAMQFSPYLLRAAVAAGVAVLGALCGVGIVRLAEGVPVGDIAAKYVLAERDDPIIKLLAHDHYDGERPAPNTVKLKPGDKGYDDAAAQSLSEWAKDDFEVYIWYDCIHLGALIAAAGFIAATAVNGRTKSCYDTDVTELELRSSTRALGGVRGGVALADMRLPRAYLWTTALPATVAGMILGFVGGYDALSATLMHMFATLPCAFGMFTLLAYWARLFHGKARTAAYIVLGLIGGCAYVFPIVLFALAMIGMSDCVLNLRYWTDFIRSD